MSEILDEIVLCSFTEKSYLCVSFTKKKIWWVNKLILIVIMLSLSKFWLYGKYSAEQIIVYSPKPHHISQDCFPWSFNSRTLERAYTQARAIHLHQIHIMLNIIRSYFCKGPLFCSWLISWSGRDSILWQKVFFFFSSLIISTLLWNSKDFLQSSGQRRRWNRGCYAKWNCSWEKQGDGVNVLSDIQQIVFPSTTCI